MRASESVLSSSFFFFNDTATTEIYTLSLHDALPICRSGPSPITISRTSSRRSRRRVNAPITCLTPFRGSNRPTKIDRKSTRLNSSHGYISYAVFCLKKKKQNQSAPLAEKTDANCSDL